MNVTTTDFLSDEELLAELVKRNLPSVAPSTIELADTARECVIGIGADNSAFIIFHEDDIERLGEIAQYDFSGLG